MATLCVPRCYATGSAGFEPVMPAEAKAHLRVEHAEEDSLISALVTAAREKIEIDTRSIVATQTWVQRMDSFPDVIHLNRGPVQSVSSVAYVDTNGDSQTVSSSDYRVNSGDPTVIEPAYGESWPTTRDVVDAVTVTFIGGYASASAVPQRLKQAVLLLVAHWYANRETVLVGSISKEIEHAYEALVGSLYRAVYL